MNASEYQQAAARTLIDDPPRFTDAEIMMVWVALGLAGEAGEVADSIKKMVLHQHGIDRDVLIKELGDVLWYFSGLCTQLNVPIGEIMDRNIAKLEARYPNGFNSADSLARIDTQV